MLMWRVARPLGTGWKPLFPGTACRIARAMCEGPVPVPQARGQQRRELQVSEHEGRNHPRVVHLVLGQQGLRRVVPEHLHCDR